VITQRRGIVSFPSEMAHEACWPKAVMAVESRYLREALARAAHEMNRLRSLEGLEYRDEDDVHAYGPFPTQERLQAMLCAADMAVTRPEHGGLVLERDSSPSAFAHYLIVANYQYRAARQERVPLKGVA